MDADEAFARYLHEQDMLEIEAMEKADRAMARQLQSQPIIDLTQENEPPTLPSVNTHFLSDYALALRLQNENDSPDAALARQLLHTVDADILTQENPDLYQLFMYFNKVYFSNMLDSVQVKWSTRMTRCAGTCTYKKNFECIVALSEPLLKFRTKKDMFETLLHEMIHALLFIQQNNTDRDAHGPEFLKEAKRISQAANLNITVYHTFHDEVDYYKTHVWKCNGKCQYAPPYFGIVKRAVNRPPQPADNWYEAHQRECGGTYTKISSPPSSSNKRKESNNTTLDNFFDPSTNKKCRK
ncbi:SprT-like family-domain-containing protein [Mucor mucedo]|uniref:SprT-like family-domain-containing protein n=1 Tax=Mucor mucedo TaxID=29922 RepID=UPI00222075E1|nr:SprT-like family-domain-containing protein [Mucor mucedo]KAI7881510.1 SprT-like family-domain-containing protein [Mucor mucedo]